MIHALVLLAILLGLGPLAAHVPHAALAGILLKVGWDIIDWGYLRRIRHAPREKVVVMVVTLGMTVFVDLIAAVAVSLILAGFVTARWIEREKLKGITPVSLANGEADPLGADERAALRRAGSAVELIMLRGNVSYASARQLTQALARGAHGPRAVVLDFTRAANIDTSAAYAIRKIVDDTQAAGAECWIAGLSGATEETLAGPCILARLPARRATARRPEAVVQAAEGATEAASSA